MCKPNLIIYLDVSPQRSLERIQSRNREMERGITLEYLSALHDNYQSFIEDISRVVPVVSIDYDQYATAEEIVAVVQRDFLDRSFLHKANRLDLRR